MGGIIGILLLTSAAFFAGRASEQAKLCGLMSEFSQMKESRLI